MLKDILDAANLYTEGVKSVANRRKVWQTKSEEVKDHLKEIAKYLDENAEYKPGYFVDVYHAFDEHINGTCQEMPSVTFRSGNLSMGLLFRNANLEVKDYYEKGFAISFNPMITGQIVVLLFAHHNNMQEGEPQAATLAVVDDLEELTMDMVDQIIAKGMTAAFYTSYTGIAERDDAAEATERAAYTPIGFRRAETTEKVKD